MSAVVIELEVADSFILWFGFPEVSCYSVTNTHKYQSEILGRDDLGHSIAVASIKHLEGHQRGFAEFLLPVIVIVCEEDMQVGAMECDRQI